MNLIGTLLLLFTSMSGTLMLYFPRIRLVGIAFLVSGLSGIVFFLFQSYFWVSGYESITLGATEAEVISTVGAPPRITDGTEWVEERFKRSDKELISGCVKEYWYESFLYPERLTFCFNANGLLLRKYRYTSW